MIFKFFQDASDFFLKGQKRSIKVRNNVFYSFLIRGLNVIVNLLFVAITLHYVGPTIFGIWIVILSFFEWINFFDVGLGNGFRNRFAESLSKNDILLAKKYVSTTYAVLCIIFVSVLFPFIFANEHIDWITIFNAPEKLKGELNFLVVIVFVSLGLRFVLKLISTIAAGDQNPYIGRLLLLISNSIVLISIYFLSISTEGSLIKLGIVVTAAPVVTFFFASVVLFQGKYKAFRPAPSCVDFALTKSIMTLGIQFFIIQVSGLILFTGINFIILHFLGPDLVTSYNVATKLFLVTTTAFSILATPFWSATTDAFASNDYNWIKNSLKVLQGFWLISVFMDFSLVVFSKYIFHFWLGDTVVVSLNLIIAMGFFMAIKKWHQMFVYFINGIGKLRLQLVICVFQAIVFIPLSIGLLKSRLGITGVVVALIICYIPNVVLLPIQLYTIISKSENVLCVKKRLPGISSS